MLARLLPKLKTVPVVVAVPKHPTLKLTAAGLAFKPNPPKLNPPAVVFPAPSPPNPAASEGRQRERENDMKGLNDKNVLPSVGSLIVKTVKSVQCILTETGLKNNKATFVYNRYNIICMYQCWWSQN